MGRRKYLTFGMLIVLIFSSIPVVSENHGVEAPDILVAWKTNGQQQYSIVFDDDSMYVAEANITIESTEGIVFPDIELEWAILENRSILHVTTDHVLQWSDDVEIKVVVQAKDGVELTPPLEVSRSFVVGIWNQPIDDHEITLQTTWSLAQNYTDEYGPQVFDLTFEGQGWQQRVGETLYSWELGSGQLWSVENTDADSTVLDLDFTSIWKNETTLNGSLLSQVFEASGDGTIWLLTNDSGMETSVTANVTSAYLKRELSNEQIDEYLRLEALGSLAVSQDEDNSQLSIDGEISVFVLEYLDEGGQRTMQHSQIEAMADFVLIDDGTRLDVELNKFIATERWVDGVRVLHLEEIQGDGTFGLEDDDDNASLVVNGTIIDFHQKIVNGSTTIDDLHVDGTLSGDVQGTFGILRTIEAKRNEANATGEMFLVNVIHQESWFNLSGIGGGSWFGSSDIGQVYNNTYDFQVVQSDWDNRTVRLKWEETGPNPSSGDEYPERSPIQNDPVEPEPAEGLGNLTITRETGLMPIPLSTGDTFVLDGQQDAILYVSVNSIHDEIWDSHSVSVIDWMGTYGNLSTPIGSAYGSIIVEGPLSGLLVNTTRQLFILDNESEENMFTESQILDKILSPSIVGSDDNTPPLIEEIRIREGLVVAEGGSIGHLEVKVTDTTWNLRDVQVDLSNIGLGIVQLNDRGLDGDMKIGDNVFTTTLISKGLERGEIEIDVTATDSFSAVDSETGTILIQNQGPRIIDIEILPTRLERGQSAVMNIQAYDGHGVSNVSLDMRSYGGELIAFTEENGIWSAMVEMPYSMTPGEQALTFVMVDGDGTQSIVSVWYPLGLLGDGPFGPHAVDTSDIEPLFLTIQNEPPRINPTTLTLEKQLDEVMILEVEIFDPDGISTVLVELGVFTPLGANDRVTMYDDGQRGGDRTAGDGIYSVELSIRDATPLGTYELLMYSTDVYGSQSSTSVIVILNEQSVEPTQSEATAIIYVFGLVLAVALIVIGLMFFQGRKDGPEKEDRFGLQ
ncbi:MAG: choice-of-anchor X domain-containing protein [Candidatus Poseidoniales archaeon]